MAILLTTTGTLNPVPIYDLNGKEFTHPTTDFDLTSEFYAHVIQYSISLQDAIDNGYVTVQDGNGNPITNVSMEAASHEHWSSDIQDFQVTVSLNADVAANTTHRGLTNNPHVVTASQVGSPDISGVPVAGNLVSWTDADTVQDSGTAISILGDVGKVYISAADTTADYLFNKLTAASPVVLATVNPGANEQRRIQVNPASTISLGIIELATQAEVDAGVASALAITPATLSNTTLAFTPVVHAATHENGGTDEISVLGLSGLLANPQNPVAHAASHRHGGTDEVATAAPGANAIPKADGSGLLDNWITVFSGAGSDGLVPDPVVESNNFLRDDGTWQVAAGSGDVTGPGSSTDNALVRFHLATGKVIQNSTGWLLGDTGTLDGSSGNLILPTAAAPAQTAEGQVIWDSDDDRLTIGDGVGRKSLMNQGDSAGGDVGGTFPTSLTVTDFTIAGEQQGSILNFNGVTWKAMAPGVAGTFLKTQGPGSNPIYDTPPDELVGVTAADTTPGYLSGKIITATAAVGFNVINPGGDEDLRIDVASSTTAIEGLIELATQVEVDAGASATLAITPATLAGTSLTFTPSAHAASHENGGADEISVAGLSGLLATAQTPISHATTHQNGGTDEIATAAPGANAIPKANGSGLLDSWISAASATVLGRIEIATQAEVDAGVSTILAVTPDTLAGTSLTFDPNAHASSHENGGADEISVAGLSGLLADSQNPTAHAASHQNGGADEIATAVPGANAIPKANAAGDLDSWITIFAGAGADGLVPDPVAATNNFLRDDGTWQVAGGDVTGPAVSEQYGITRFADTTGKVIEDSQVRIYDAGAADPAGPPAATDGDLYYNTTLGMWIRYDGSRSKWLSIESNTVQVGNNGNVPKGTYFKGIAGQLLSATIGYTSEWNGTVVGMSWTRGDSDAAQFNVMADGVAIENVASAATSGYDNTIDGDFSQGDVLAAQNDSGGNAVQLPQIWIKFRWRTT
jgi:hypothetical protein